MRSNAARALVPFGSVSDSKRIALYVVPPSASTGLVPDVVGLSEAQAGIDIVAAGFVTGTTTAYSDSVAIGNVISQSPTAGSTAVLGSTVTITVSLGPAQGNSVMKRRRR